MDLPDFGDSAEPGLLADFGDLADLDFLADFGDSAGSGDSAALGLGAGESANWLTMADSTVWRPFAAELSN